MVRTQIQLTEEQARKLKRLAAARGQSLAQLIRLSVDALLAQPAVEITPEERRRRALAIVGRFHSGVSGITADHDRYLAEAYRR
ncbi:MAG: ribbon-helix-helix protein, CopG family [Terriglobales bacterium]